jgi:beta-galactosidase
LAFVPFVSLAQLVDKTPAPIPVVPTVYQTQPYEDPSVSGINREPSRATAYSYASVEDAIQKPREQSGRYMSLNGDWDFAFALKPGDEPQDFTNKKYKVGKKYQYLLLGKCKVMTSLFIKVLYILFVLSTHLLCQKTIMV